MRLSSSVRDVACLWDLQAQHAARSIHLTWPSWVRRTVATCMLPWFVASALAVSATLHPSHSTNLFFGPTINVNWDVCWSKRAMPGPNRRLFRFLAICLSRSFPNQLEIRFLP